MSKCIFCRAAFRWLLLVLVTLAIHQGCKEGSPIASWDCPKMATIETNWNAVETELHGNVGSKDENLIEGRYKVLATQLSLDDLRGLLASCDSLPIADRQRGEFINAVLAFMVERFVDSGDRQSVVRLLSKRCPIHISFYHDIEFFLAYRGNKLKDPILVLGNAYSECTIPDVRHDIAGAVRRGFAGMGIRGADDADFVRNAMQWYEQEKSHLTVNPMYWQNAVVFKAEDYETSPDLYERFPPSQHRQLLFERKDSRVSK